MKCEKKKKLKNIIFSCLDTMEKCKEKKNGQQKEEEKWQKIFLPLFLKKGKCKESVFFQKLIFFSLIFPWITK